ncbi:MAG: ATP-binding protein [Candidatus Eisenbacteria bacterium]|nr:ATP-binding protein [Candidatus Eisenbacteria bacterium]
MISRSDHLQALSRLLRQYPVVAILGARQVGKTTLARQLAAAWRGQVTWLDLEDPADRGRLADPGLALKGLHGLVVIDEIQRAPEIFAYLRVLSDRRPLPARFLVLGSAAPGLLRQGSESLAGRIHFHTLSGLSLGEVGMEETDRLLLRGGFPRSYLARSATESHRWRLDFVRTFLERDVPELGSKIPSATLRRFWTMLAHYHGQTWNGAELGRAFGVSHSTVRNYLDLLTAALVVRQIPPWFENLSKRQVKAPKVYIIDPGLLHTLLGVRTAKDLESHPKLGASWEGFALAETIQRLGAEPEECYFWATHGGAEVDLLVVRGRTRLAFEFKRTSAPASTRSMHEALSSLKLDRLDVIYPGDRSFSLTPSIRAVGLTRLHQDIKPLSSTAR